MGLLLKGAGKILKRAFTKDGGSLLATKVEGESNGFAVAVVVARFIAPVIAGGLALWIAKLLGVPVSELLETAKQIGESFS